MIIITCRGSVVLGNYYPLKIILQSINYYCLWHSDDKDTIIMRNNSILSYSEASDLNEYCQNLGIITNTEITEYNLDQFYEWLSSDKTNIDCKEFLNFWNIANDLAYSAGDIFYGDNDDAYNVYDKLFHGNNLPSVNTSPYKYIPVWPDDEIEVIEKAIQSGLSLFEKYLKAEK